MKYLFHLGREPQLSQTEIEIILAQKKIKYTISQTGKQYIVLKAENPIDPKEMMDRLGGTISIAEHINTQQDMLASIVKYLDEITPKGKIRFSISPVDKKRALTVKKELKEKGRSVRYIEPKNTATIIHNNLVKKQTDLTIANNELYVTRVVQPIAAFSKRDYGRPASDSKSGMLPPKLARILINLSGADKQDVICDPFCGSGTIIMEAGAMEYMNIIASDASVQAIADTKQNISWLKKERIINEKQNISIMQSNVRALSKRIKRNSVDYIITEPHLGKPLKGRETKGEIEKQTKELSQLYIDAFNVFKNILKPQGVAVFIIPKFRFKNEWIDVNCIEKIEQIGFKIVPLTKKDKSLLYWRTKQHVGREIWKFERIK